MVPELTLYGLLELLDESFETRPQFNSATWNVNRDRYVSGFIGDGWRYMIFYEFENGHHQLCGDQVVFCWMEKQPDHSATQRNFEVENKYHGKGAAGAAGAKKRLYMSKQNWFSNMGGFSGGCSCWIMRMKLSLIDEDHCFRNFALFRSLFHCFPLSCFTYAAVFFNSCIRWYKRAKQHIPTKHGADGFFTEFQGSRGEGDDLVPCIFFAESRYLKHVEPTKVYAFKQAFSKADFFLNLICQPLGGDDFSVFFCHCKQNIYVHIYTRI